MDHWVIRPSRNGRKTGLIYKLPSSNSISVYAIKGEQMVIDGVDGLVIILDLLDNRS